ncbi:LysE family translocator [Sodalis ligni]|uniref:Threonine/homoserine/homoserine lactone efflux protein n=1 Tax=Sodalis ligni TaxID=2697027 RepID=A0A4R1NHB1_9GAMM|nr:LysE family translocator [Sodalis ligni]TCL06992.1 threonine/homoserine/homoserine lactone efflux protein [Sodalis ligni]
MAINFFGFMPALLPVALSPGASFTLVMSGALAGGRSGLFRTLAGTALGIYTHALLIGLGITAVIVSSPAIFGALKIAGTVYLLWLGLMLVVSGIKSKRTELTIKITSITIKQAWLANVLNPKAIMFYLTVVSQFAGIDGGISNYLTLASVHVGVMSIWLIAISHALIFSAKKTNPLLLKKYVNIAGGLLLIIFSLHSIIR